MAHTSSQVSTPGCALANRIGLCLFLRVLVRTFLSVLLFAGTQLLIVSANQNHAILNSQSGFDYQEPQAPISQGKRLNLGDQLTQEIVGGETQITTVSMSSGQYAVVGFEWDGIDCDVTVQRPDATRVFATDIQVRASGSLPISLIAEVRGEYQLHVKPVENLKIRGRYDVTLKVLRLATPLDRERFDGQQRLARGELDETQTMALFREAPELWPDADSVYYQAHAFMQLARKSLAKPTLGAKSPEEYYGLAMAKRQNDSALKFAYLLLDIGDDYRNLGSRQTALDYFKRALNMFESLNDRRGAASALYKIGFTKAKMGDLKEALIDYDHALTIQRDLGNVLAEARTLNAMGGAHIILGNHSEALRLLDECAANWSQLGDTYRAAITVNNIADVYHNLGEFQTAYDKHAEALRALKLRLRDLSPAEPAVACVKFVSICAYIADMTTNLGEIHNSLGDPDAALEKFEEALKIHEILGLPEGLGYTYSSIAYAHLLKGEPGKALDFCDQALSFSTRAKDHRRSAITLTVQGMAYSALGETDKAIECYQNSLRLQEQVGERREEAIALDKMGVAYGLKNDPDKTVAYLNRALQIWLEVGDQNGETITRYNLARAASRRGDLESARKEVGIALNIIESKRNGLTSKNLRGVYRASRENYYELDIDLKMQMSKSTDSSELVAEALQSSEKARARILLDDIGEAGVTREAAADLKKRADPKFAELVNRRERTSRRLNEVSQSRISVLGRKHTQEEVVGIDKEINVLASESDELENQIVRLNPRFAALVKPVPLTAKEIQQQVDDETLLLAYSLGDKRSYVWAVAQDSIKSFELKGRKEIEASAERMVKSLSERNRREKNDSPRQVEIHRAQADAEYSAASVELSRMVLQPVAALLGNKRLVIVADGALQLVPFQALPNPNRSGVVRANAFDLKKAGPTNERSPMIEDHEIVYEPSASVLALQRKEFGRRVPARHELAVIADPVFDQEGVKTELERRAANVRTGQAQPNLISKLSSTIPNETTRLDLTRSIDDMEIGAISPLPQSRDEAEGIMKLVPEKERMAALGFDASRATAMNPDLSQYRILHIATHGFANFKHPELSGIVLSLVDEKGRQQDGFLRLHDIYNLNLPADLVVLSACQTGVGKQIKGEGLIALTRGFTYAGAARVVASLWKVDDEATKDLMEEFYKQMFTNKLKPAAALRKAQIKLYRQSQWHSPFYWGGFILQGEWR